jgi:cbb3-type cytochrome oxidase subunit 3
MNSRNKEENTNKGNRRDTIKFLVSIITAFIAIFSFAVPAFQFNHIRKIEIQQQEIIREQQEFENYHNLIEQINAGRVSAGRLDDDYVYLQVQQAAIYELRYYERYKELTLKLLSADWYNNDRLSWYVEDTIEYLTSQD